MKNRPSRSDIRRRPSWGARSDAGMTLPEVTVTLAVMSVVMAVVTTGIVQMYQSVNRSESMSMDAAQLQTAYQGLDRAVRYASAISEPNVTATADGGWYVEWSAAAGAGTVCTQMRLHTSSGRLQRRSQPAGGPISGWTTVASSVVGERPFAVDPASTDGFPHQRLTVSLVVRSDQHGSQPGRRSVFTFTALNTTLATVASGVCAGMDRP